jgi:hypothetical protein
MFEKLAKTGRTSPHPEMMGVGRFVKRFQRLG